MTPTAPTWDALRQLAKNWREQSTGDGPAHYYVRQCAGDLEAVLSAALASASAGQEAAPLLTMTEPERAEHAAFGLVTDYLGKAVAEIDAQRREIAHGRVGPSWSPAPTVLQEIHTPFCPTCGATMCEAHGHSFPSEDDVPLPLRRELMQAATAKGVSYYWLTAIYRQGLMAAPPSAPETPQTCETWTKEAVRDEFLKLASWIKTPGNISRDDAIDEIARVLTNCALQVMMGAPPPPSESRT